MYLEQNQKEKPQREIISFSLPCPLVTASCFAKNSRSQPLTIADHVVTSLPVHGCWQPIPSHPTLPLFVFFLVLSPHHIMDSIQSSMVGLDLFSERASVVQLAGATLPMALAPILMVMFYLRSQFDGMPWGSRLVELHDHMKSVLHPSCCRGNL